MTKFFFILFFSFLFFSCNHNRFSVDLSNVNLPIRFINLDSVVVHSDSNAFYTFCNSPIIDKGIISYLTKSCLQIGDVNKDDVYKRISIFRNDTYISSLEKEIRLAYTTKINSKSDHIINGFKRAHFFLPQLKLPTQVYYMNSLFANYTFVHDNSISIGLEWYLGSNNPVIQQLPSNDFHLWMKKGMNPDFFERDLFFSWLLAQHPCNSPVLVEQMIHYGKLLYVSEICFTNLPAHLILRYPKSKFNWAISHENMIWKYLVDQQLLFSSNEREITGLLKEGPFSLGLPEAGPDRLGQFIGWKMVHSFMENESDFTLNALMKTNYNQILQSYQID